ncbi:MAG: sigma-54-dependent Fis family transcriptional regulator [Rhodobacteraceae bacterium]|nr:sigma-54-dependent Fis family transcriptional regulator [Paracoccaceae bacterium]
MESFDLDSAGTIWNRNVPRILIAPVLIGGTSVLPFVSDCLQKTPDLQAIMIVERNQINEASEAMRLGVADCLFKPFSGDRLRKTLVTALTRLGQKQGIAITVARSDKRPSPAKATAEIKPRNNPSARPRPQEILIGSHQVTKNLRREIQAVATSSAPVLIRGESGTGKSLAAQLVHTASKLTAAPFYRINSAAITLENLQSEPTRQPDKITYYLEEICDLCPDVQARMIGMINSKTFSNARLISSTSQNPDDAIQDGRLRRDFYHRISATQIEVPPLRARRADIAEIAREKLRGFTLSEGGVLEEFSVKAMNQLLGYFWPGNIRQLTNVIRNIVVLHGQNGGPVLVEPHMLPPDLKPDMQQDQTPPLDFSLANDEGAEQMAHHVRGLSLARVERIAIEAAIKSQNGSVTRAAKLLDVAPSTVYRKRQSWRDG